MPDALTVLFSKTVTLNNDQIKALPTTPIEIISSPGPSKMIAAKSLTISLNDTAGAYTNVDNTLDSYAALIYGATYEADATEAIQGLTNYIFTPQRGIVIIAGVGIKTTVQFSIAQTENMGIYLYFDNNSLGNITGGNAANTMKVIVSYEVIDL